MDAEKQKSDSERCHRSLAEQFYAAQNRVYELRKLLEKDILKSKPYFDMKNRLNTALSEVKTRTVKLQSSITAAKRAYSLALSNLEMISEEIHRKRTPGVGAEYEHDDHDNNKKCEEPRLSNHNHNSSSSTSNNRGQRGAKREEEFSRQDTTDRKDNDESGEQEEDDDEEDTLSRSEQAGLGRRGDGASSSSSGQISCADDRD